MTECSTEKKLFKLLHGNKFGDVENVDNTIECDAVANAVFRCEIVDQRVEGGATTKFSMFASGPFVGEKGSPLTDRLFVTAASRFSDHGKEANSFRFRSNYGNGEFQDIPRDCVMFRGDAAYLCFDKTGKAVKQNMLYGSMGIEYGEGSKIAVAGYDSDTRMLLSFGVVHTDKRHCFALADDDNIDHQRMIGGPVYLVRPQMGFHGYIIGVVVDYDPKTHLVYFSPY